MPDQEKKNKANKPLDAAAEDVAGSSTDQEVQQPAEAGATEAAPSPPPGPPEERGRFGVAMPIPGEPLPLRPGARTTRQNLPPLPDPEPGRAMPGPPHSSTRIHPEFGDEQRGLQRQIENLNLDAMAQGVTAERLDPASADALSTIVQGGMVPVPVNGIDRELIRIWKSTTSGGEHEGKISVTLMRVMNLVVYAEDNTRAEAANAAIDHVVRRHPCRTIMIVNESGTIVSPDTLAGPSADRDLEAAITAHCHTTTADGKQVCCEQIDILAHTGSALSRVSNLALNLLITDLPVFLWCAGGTAYNNIVLAHLEDNIDRLILDSGGFPDPLAGLLAMARSVDPTFRNPDAARYVPSDLNWGRLEGLREATAALFDSPDLVASLARIGSVEIAYAAPTEGQGANPVQGLLYAAWLASRLGWEFHSGGPAGGRAGANDAVLTMRAGVRSISIVLRAQAGPTAGPGEVHSVRLVTNDARPRTITLGLSADAMYMDCVVSDNGQEHSALKVRYSAPDEVSLLDSQLELFGHDPVYIEALIMAGRMAWGSLSAVRRSQISAQLGTESRHSSFDPRF